MHLQIAALKALKLNIRRAKVKTKGNTKVNKFFITDATTAEKIMKVLHAVPPGAFSTLSACKLPWSWCGDNWECVLIISETALWKRCLGLDTCLLRSLPAQDEVSSVCVY